MGMDAGDIHDAAAGRILPEHLPANHLRQKKGCPQIDRQHVLPIVGCRFQHRLDAIDAGVVHQSVDAAESFDGLPDQVSQLIVLAHVAGDRQGPLDERRRDRLGLAVANVGDHHVQSLAMADLGDPLAQAAAGAGDDHDLAIQEQHGPSRCFQEEAEL